MTRSLTQLFRQFVLRGFLASLAAGLLLAGATVTAAYAAGNGTGGNSAAASHAKPGTPASASPRSPGSANSGSAARTNTSSPRSASKPASAPGSKSPNSANGNKGHIQIEGPLDCGSSPCGEDNDPHLSCSVTLELFGYPSGTDSATVAITGQQPSGTGTVLNDSFTFTGSSSPRGNILDTYKTYSLYTAQLTGAGLTAQPQQGYHLRIEVAVNGFHAKTHVVWLQPCTTAPVIPGSSAGALLPGDTPSADTGLTGTRGLARPTAGGAPDTAAPDTTAADTPPPDTPALDTPATPAALTASPAQVSAGSRSSGRLAFTGLGLGLAIALVVAALGLGGRLLVLSRRAKRVSV